jgi:hypothetical protein
MPRRRHSRSYYNFFNGETEGRQRIFNGAGAKWTPNSRTALLGQFDFGSLEAADGGDGSTWYGFTVIGRFALSDHVALAGRFERFDDEDQVNIATGLSEPFRGNGASIGLDVTPQSRFLWRTELRGFWNQDSIFPDADGPNTFSSRSVFMVSSLGLIF